MTQNKTSVALPHYKLTLLGALILFLGYFVPAMGIGFISVLSMFIFHENLQYNDWFLIVTNSFVFVCAIWTFDYFVCRPQTGKKLNFNFSITDISTLLIIFPLMFGMILVAEYFTNLIPVTGPFFGPLYEFFSEMMSQLSGDLPTMVIMAVIMAPLFEEIVFRGIIQKGMINNGVAPKYAILISSIIFGLIHGNPWQFVGATLLGIVLGTVYYKTQSLLLPMLLHCFNNLLSTILMEYNQTESLSVTLHIPEWQLLISGLVLLGIFGYLLFKKYKTPVLY